MYLKHYEWTIIKHAVMEGHFYLMDEIIFSHRLNKLQEFDRKEIAHIISKLRKKIWIHRLDAQTFVCTNHVRNVQMYNDGYRKEELRAFEDSIRVMDEIGSNVTENPFVAILNHNNHRKEREQQYDRYYR